jgi:glutamate synthase (NADPH/NADH) small chain
MPTLAADERIKGFSEVALGYTPEEARAEAVRCLNCKTRPCVQGCPVGVPIPEFIKEIREDRLEEAHRLIKSMNLLPAICGRVCPQEKQCEQYCVRGKKGEAVGIGNLERFVADCFLNEPSAKDAGAGAPGGVKVAVIGSGPSGLTCAGELARQGCRVTVFEALHQAGGVLTYGIPEFRLPKGIVAREIANLEALGVILETNMVVGKSVSLDELLHSRGFAAIYIGSGAGLPSFMGIAGEDLNGVYSANEFLTRINLMKAYEPEARTPIYRARRAIVVGGGNVAMDAARCARRLGAETAVVYRRTERELPARLEEVRHAKEEGIDFKMLTAPVRLEADEHGWVKSLLCLRMELGAADASGRRAPHPVPGSEFELEADCVIMAIGNSPNPLLSKSAADLETDAKGRVVLKDAAFGLTSKKGVYAGGDAVTGAATVILAMGAGKAAAQGIMRDLGL